MLRFSLMKKITILLILLFILIKPAEGLEFEKLNLPTQMINPGDFYYSAIRLWEKLSEKLQFSNSAKIKYETSLLDKRMSELGYVVKNKRLGEVQHSSERLAFTVGTLTDNLIKLGNQQMNDQLKKKIDSYFQPLSELRDNFPANSSFWMLVQHDINFLKIYSEKLTR